MIVPLSGATNDGAQTWTSCDIQGSEELQRAAQSDGASLTGLCRSQSQYKGSESGHCHGRGDVGEGLLAMSTGRSNGQQGVPQCNASWVGLCYQETD